jgi:hypothetical protein
MRKIFLLTVITFFTTSICKSQGSKLILYYHKHRTGEAAHANLHIKVPNYNIYSFMSGKKRRNRSFYLLSSKDSGTLFVYFFYGNNMLEISKPRFDSTIQPAQFLIKRNETLWLDITSVDSTMYKLQNSLPMPLLTEAEFASKYERAYSIFKRRGFRKVIDNVPLNVDEKPTREEVKYVRKNRNIK